MSHIQPQKNRPHLLRPDNFTPPARTPWGGRRIPQHYKSALLEGDFGVVGESWELSVEPDFPSRLQSAMPLAEAIATDPEGWLGDGSRKNTALLVKLLDAASPLSVQIHPADDDPALSAEESGKPESWYVADADEGAGLYLGLEEGVDEARLREAITAGEDVSKLLHFVAVQPGDFFVIDAGTPHAIGPGLTLVEPQRVLPGRRGLTYRYWDWNRRYTDGRLDPEGQPRALHLEEALRVTRWDLPRSAAFLEGRHLRLGAPGLDDTPQWQPLAGEGGLTFDALGVARLSGTGAFALPEMPRLRCLTLLAGQARCGDVTLCKGQSAVLPAAFQGETWDLEGVHSIVSWIP